MHTSTVHSYASRNGPHRYGQPPWTLASQAMYTKHKVTRLSYPWEPSRNANSGCSHEESRESFFLPLGKNSSEEIFFQTGRKGKVRRKGHPTPLHVGTQDNPFIGIIGWSSWFMMNSWSLVASLLGSYAPTLNHHMPWVPAACVLLVEPGLGIRALELAHSR